MTNPIPRDIRDNPLLIIAWRDCLFWSVANPAIMLAFRSDTGIDWVNAVTPLESMVDEATGRIHAQAATYIRWFNSNVWGPTK